jgi:hypothetical protein
VHEGKTRAMLASCLKMKMNNLRAFVSRGVETQGAVTKFSLLAVPLRQCWAIATKCISA